MQHYEDDEDGGCDGGVLSCVGRFPGINLTKGGKRPACITAANVSVARDGGR